VDWANLTQQLINGLSLGAIYALIALGYTMVYGVLRFINFAHGDVFMIGAFAGLYVHRWLKPFFAGMPDFLSAPIVLLLSMAICATLGILIEKLAYKPLRQRSRLHRPHHGYRSLSFSPTGAAFLWKPLPKVSPSSSKMKHTI
jgi:branched-subunit amino acid ABC-type transport system permease component